MNALTSTNRAKIGLVAETSFGSVPAAPAWANQRISGAPLKFAPKTVQSNEIRPDGQVTDLIIVGTENSGDLTYDISYQSIDTLLAACVGNNWQNKPSITVATAGVDISAVSTTTLTVAAGGAAFVSGMLTLIQNMPTGSNNGLQPVSSSSGTTIVYPAGTFTAETATIPVGASVRQVGFQGISGDIAATSSGLSSTVLNFTTLGLNVGETVVVGDTDVAGCSFATAGCNGRARISAIAAHALTFDILPLNWATDAGTGKTIRVYCGDFLVNGTLKQSFSIEVQQQDAATPFYEYYTGMFVDKLTLNVEAEKVVTATVTFKGKTKVAQTARWIGSTDIAPTTWNFMNASTNVGLLQLAGVNVNETGPNYIQKMSIDINANGIMALALGVNGPVDIPRGEYVVTGTTETYLGDTSQMNLLINNTAFDQIFKIGRQDGNRESYCFDFPCCKYSSGETPVSGKNQLRMFSGGFQALRDPVKTYTNSVGRHWYLPASNNN